MSNLREAAQRVMQRLNQEAISRNSAYDRYGMGNTPATVDVDAYALACAALSEPDDKAQPVVPDFDDFVDCDECSGAGFRDVERQVAERKSDVQTFREQCEVCNGSGKEYKGELLYAAPQPPAEQNVTLGGGFPGDHNGTKAALREDALERLWNAHWEVLKSMSDEDINKLDEQGVELSDEQVYHYLSGVIAKYLREHGDGFAVVAACRALIAADRAARGGV